MTEEQKKDSSFIAGYLSGISKTCDKIVKLYWANASRVDIKDWCNQQIDAVKELRNGDKENKGKELHKEEGKEE